MTKKLLDEILALVGKTGDTCIVIKDENPFVVMGFGRYKQLILDTDEATALLTEEGDIHTINREIALLQEGGDVFSVDTSEKSGILESTTGVLEGEHLYYSNEDILKKFN